MLHTYGPVEGTRHDWTLYTKSEMDWKLEDAFLVNEIQMCIYSGSGYNFCVYLEVTFQGASISEEMAALNSAMSTVRVCVEWLFMEVKLH